MSRGKLESCFACVLLEDHPATQVNRRLKNNLYKCGATGATLSLVQASTPFDCEFRKENYDEPVVLEFTGKEAGVERLYHECTEFALKKGRPFTMREFFGDSNYTNKNSLWDLFETLVRYDLLQKGDTKFINPEGHTYEAKAYYPRFTCPIKYDPTTLAQMRKIA